LPDIPCCNTSLFKKLLARKPFQKRFDRKPEKRLSLRTLPPNPIGVINRLNGCGTSLFKKGLTENETTFEFEDLTPKPYRRDQPAQRLRVNGCGSTVAAQRFVNVHRGFLLQFKSNTENKKARV
jgi:hypothetical protein